MKERGDIIMNNILKDTVVLLKECEIEYLSYYTTFTDYDNYRVYADKNIKNMYTHNFTYIKSGLKENTAFSLVKEKIKENKEKSFLNFLFAPDYSLDWNEFKSLGLEVSFLLYMIIETQKLDIIKLNNECTVKIADNEKMLFDGIICEIKGGDDGFPFLYKCNTHKKNVFLQNKDNLFYFVAYINEVPVGKCEVLINAHLLRIESLLVLDSFRGKGIASSILISIKEFALQKNIKTIYLMAEEEDTPKLMYSKMGFNIVGKETWMLWEKS